MKISHKINLVLISILILMTIAVIVPGTLIISKLAYNYQDQVLNSELRKSRQVVTETLNRSGLQAAVRAARELQADLKHAPLNMKTAKVFIFEAPDRVVFHIDYKLGESIQWPELEQMFQQREGNVEYTDQSTAYHGVFTTIQPIGWLVCLSISKQEMFAQKRDYLRYIGIIAAVVVCISSFVVSLMVGRFVRRIQKTLDCVKQIEKGDLEALVHPISVKDEIGRLQAGVNAMSVEIKLRTIERQKAEKTLRRYEHIISSTNDLMSFVDKNYIYQAVNNAYLIAHAKKREEIIGFSVENLIGTEKFQNLVKANLDLTLNGERVKYQAWFEYAGIGRRFMDVTYYPFKDTHDEEINGVVVAVHDLTERKQTEEELKIHHDHLEDLVNERTADLEAAKEVAEKANASKSDFLARMSHEIRTPLNAVTGLTNIVLKTELTVEQRDYLNKVQIASNNLLEVINDILDFSRVEAGRLELANALFDLDRVIEQLADLFNDRVCQKDLELIFTIAPDVPRQLIGDAGRLTQVLTNLVENAVKFTETGEIVVGVNIKEDGRGTNGYRQQLIFEVSDTGIGIATDVLPTLFYPFTQAEGYLTRKHEGAGLGLAICQRLVELMDGRIWAESTPGQGSKFSFTVMLETGMEGGGRMEAMVQHGPQEPAGLPIKLLNGHRVLVVEDSELNRDVAVALLEEVGMAVEVADNGSMAVAKVTKSPKGYYDAVLMDIQMPTMDGYEATKIIREFEKEQDTTSEQQGTKVPIIALTAHALKGEKEKCLATNMNDYLAKPLDVKDLYWVLLKWIAPWHGEINT
jgi:PAS domain S-box-containing protein